MLPLAFTLIIIGLLFLVLPSGMRQAGVTRRRRL